MADKKFIDEIEEELKEAEKELAVPEEVKEVKEEPKRLSRVEIARKVQQLR